MSLVFAAITPHPPMLLPAVGKEKQEALQQTMQAMQALESELYTAKPQCIFVISPHSGLFANSFTVNAHTHVTSAFEKFGDLTTEKTWHGSPEMAARITELAKKERVPVQAISEEKIDHGASVPLWHITTHLPDIKVLPIGFSGLDPETHLRFGRMLKEIIMTSEKRIAIIASGDLSHSLSEDAPAGYSPHGAAFDGALCAALRQRDHEAIIHMDQTMIAEADECGYRSILILLGILEHMRHQFVQQTYEHPFGIGYLTGHYVF